MNRCNFYVKTLGGKVECGALKQMQCAGCGFFKTERQFLDDLAAAEARLKSLKLRVVKKFDGEKVIMTTEAVSEEWQDIL